MSNEQIEQQAIEEMAKVIKETERIAKDTVGALPSPTMQAKRLYWKGYRKIDEPISCDHEKGEWEKRGNKKTCSLCGFIYFSNNDNFKFCPNCGTRMTRIVEIFNEGGFESMALKGGV